MGSKSLQERFNQKYSVCQKTGCWIWHGAKFVSSGYGKIALNGKMLRAHRVSYMLHKGDIPSGKHVCHSCDNPLCVNPDHLWLGTDADNMRDKQEKGRCHNTNGSENGRSKLTENDVLQIRHMLDQGISQKTLTAIYGVHNSQISRIKARKIWGHI